MSTVLRWVPSLDNYLPQCGHARLLHGVACSFINGLLRKIAGVVSSYHSSDGVVEDGFSCKSFEQEVAESTDWGDSIIAGGVQPVNNYSESGEVAPGVWHEGKKSQNAMTQPSRHHLERDLTPSYVSSMNPFIGGSYHEINSHKINSNEVHSHQTNFP